MISESAKPRHPLGEVGRQRRDELAFSFSDAEFLRVGGKDEALGVERETREFDARERAGAAVLRVAENRVPFGLEVDSDLVPTPRRDSNSGEKGGVQFISETFDDLNLGKGRLPFDRAVHPKRREARVPASHRQVFLFHEVFFEPTIRLAVGGSVPRDEKDPGRFAIDPVDRDMATLWIEARKEFQDARLARVRAGHRQESGGLIHDDEVRIFPKDREFGVHALNVTG